MSADQFTKSPRLTFIKQVTCIGQGLLRQLFTEVGCSSFRSCLYFDLFSTVSDQDSKGDQTDGSQLYCPRISHSIPSNQPQQFQFSTYGNYIASDTSLLNQHPNVTKNPQNYICLKKRTKSLTLKANSPPDPIQGKITPISCTNHYELKLKKKNVNLHRSPVC